MARKSAAVSVQNSRPIYVDPSHPAFHAYLGDPLVSLRLDATELDDPESESGALLCVSEIGAETTLTAEVGDHILGMLSDRALRAFLAAVSDPTGDFVIAPLADLRNPHKATGVDLVVDSQGRLTIDCGSHCFGICRGAHLRLFLAAAASRANLGIGAARNESRNVTCIAHSAKWSKAGHIEH